MLNLIKSNRMETLGQALCQVISKAPDDDPMAPEWIGVQSRGMRQWVTAQIAQTLGVCANVSFMFPKQIMEALLSPEPDNSPRPAASLITEDMILWSVMDLLNANRLSAHESLKGLTAYAAHDPSGRKGLQLSSKIAGILDGYQVYRPDMLLKWQENQLIFSKDPKAREIEQWQSLVWNQVSGQHQGFADLMTVFLKKGGVPEPTVPERICLFGICAMPVSFLRILSALSRHRDVYLFLLTPCSQFFFDIPSPKQAGRAGLELPRDISPADPFFEPLNPLLSALGKTGRDFFSCLEELDYDEPFGELFQDPFPDNGQSAAMLSILQSDILNLTQRKPDGDAVPVEISATDRSISIHACHSPMREAQVLKDLLLDAFDRDKNLHPHDVIVMMPDVESYAPCIEAVFSHVPGQSSPGIPFTLSDRRKRVESPVMEAVLSLLAMTDSRFERNRVLALLAFDPIGARFDIAPGEVSAIEEAVVKANVFWGRDGAHRQKLTRAGFEENTWMFGLDRLFSGMALPEDAFMAGKVCPLPYFEGLDADLLGKLAHFIHTLAQSLDRFEEQMTLGQWARCLKQVVSAMLAPGPGDEPDLRFVFTTLDTLAQDAETAGFTGTLSVAAIREIITKKLDCQTSHGRFMAGAVTFCNLTPMRSIPFKVVVLMGMDEAAFPRSFFQPGFDLAARFPRKGDKQARDEDRYLFLESILSARDCLMITYTGMSIKDNSPIPCSGVVSELMGAMEHSFRFPSGFPFFAHPLQGFSPVYFNQTPGFFSYSQKFGRMAASLSDRSGSSGLPFIDLAPPTESYDPLTDESEILTLSPQDLVRFFRNPVKAYVIKRLGLELPLARDPDPDRETFNVRGLDAYTLGEGIFTFKDLIETRSADLYHFFRAQGSLPLGKKGELEFLRFLETARPIALAAEQMIPPTPCGPVRVDMMAGGFRISGVIKDLFVQDGALIRCMAGFGKLNGARLLSHWIYHLILNQGLSQKNVTGLPGGLEVSWARARMAGQDPDGKKPAALCGFSPLGPKAAPILETLIALYARGREHLIPFFSATGFALAATWGEKADAPEDVRLLAAFNRANSAWFNSFSNIGDKTDPYVQLCFQGQDPFDSMTAFNHSGILETALAVYQPLLEDLADL